MIERKGKGGTVGNPLEASQVFSEGVLPLPWGWEGIGTHR